MKLARREKYLVGLAGAGVVLFLIFQFIVFPFFDQKERLQKGLRAKEVGLQEMMLLRAEYQSRRAGSRDIQDVLAAREKDFALFSFLEQAAGEAKVKGYIKYMKPSSSQAAGPYEESMVEMKLEGITLKQLTDYLYRIESPEKLVSIKRISIKENKRETGYLDAILQVITVQRGSS